MSIQRQIWGPRTEQTALVLTAAFQFTPDIDIMQGANASNAVVIDHCLAALAVQYSGGTASTGRAEVVVEWAHVATGPYFRPATGAEQQLEVADAAGDVNNVIGVGTPGGFRIVRFGIREIGDPANPGTVTTQSSGEYPL